MFEVAASEEKQSYGYQIICLFTLVTLKKKKALGKVLKMFHLQEKQIYDNV